MKHPKIEIPRSIRVKRTTALVLLILLTLNILPSIVSTLFLFLSATNDPNSLMDYKLVAIYGQTASSAVAVLAWWLLSTVAANKATKVATYINIAVQIIMIIQAVLQSYCTHFAADILNFIATALCLYSVLLIINNNELGNDKNWFVLWAISFTATFAFNICISVFGGTTELITNESEALTAIASCSAPINLFVMILMLFVYTKMIKSIAFSGITAEGNTTIANYSPKSKYFIVPLVCGIMTAVLLSTYVYFLYVG